MSPPIRTQHLIHGSTSQTRCSMNNLMVSSQLIVIYHIIGLTTSSTFRLTPLFCQNYQLLAHENARPGVGTPDSDKSLFYSRSHRIRLTDMSMFSHCHAPNRMSTTCMRTSGSKQGATEKGSADDEQWIEGGRCRNRTCDPFGVNEVR